MADQTPQDALTPITAHSEPPARAYKRLTYQQLRIVRDLYREGKTQVEIAQVLGVNQTTISRAIRNLVEDSSDLAQDYAKATAYRRARRLNGWSKHRDKVGLDAAKHLDNLAGLTNTSSGGNAPQVLVQIGVSGVPLVSDQGAKVVVRKAETFASTQETSMNTGVARTKV